MAKKLFVGGINFNSTEDTIKEVFARYGEIISFRLIRDRVTGKSKGFAFITFRENEDADRAMLELNGTDVDGRMIGVKLALDKKT